MNIFSRIKNKIDAKKFEECTIMYIVCKFKYEYSLRLVRWTGKVDRDGFPVIMKRRNNGTYYTCSIYRAVEPDGSVINWYSDRQIAEQTVDTFNNR